MNREVSDRKMEAALHAMRASGATILEATKGVAKALVSQHSAAVLTVAMPPERGSASRLSPPIEEFAPA